MELVTPHPSGFAIASNRNRSKAVLSKAKGMCKWKGQWHLDPDATAFRAQWGSKRWSLSCWGRPLAGPPWVLGPSWNTSYGRKGKMAPQSKWRPCFPSGAEDEVSTTQRLELDGYSKAGHSKNQSCMLDPCLCRHCAPSRCSRAVFT